MTHIQSGNVIFSSTASAADVKAGIEALIDTDLGKTVTAIIRTAAQMTKVTASHPLMTEASDPKSLYVVFLDRKPPSAAAAALAAMEFAGERLQVVGEHVYLDYGTAHAGTSKLNNAIIERKLGVPATSRELGCRRQARRARRRATASDRRGHRVRPSR